MWNMIAKGVLLQAIGILRSTKMAKTSSMTVDITSDLFSLSAVRCDNYSCVYRNRENDNCALKHIKIDVDGKCENYRTANMLA